MKVEGFLKEQLLTGYETLGLSTGQLSEQFEIPEAAVKGLLLEESKQYREEQQQGGGSRVEDLLRNYELLAETTKSPAVKEKSLRYLIDELKGRNDIGLRALELKQRQTRVSEVDLSLKIQQFNEQISQTRSLKEEILKKIA